MSKRGRPRIKHPEGKLICCRCKQAKEYAEYTPSKTNTGYRAYCNNCWKEYISKYYANNKDRYKDRYQRKRDELIEYQKNWNRQYLSELCNLLRVRAYNRWAGVLDRKQIYCQIPFDELLGCTKEFLLEHFRSQYKDGMTDTNYGSEWEIDHILPICSFDLTDEDQLRKCFHYSNLQPLWIHENQEKGITLPDGSKPYIDRSNGGRPRKKLSGR